MKIFKGVIKYAKIAVIWVGIIGTSAMLFFFLSKHNKRTNARINNNIKSIHKLDGKIKTDIGSATADNSTALDFVSRFEKTNERFRKLILKIQKDTKN